MLRRLDGRAAGLVVAMMATVASCYGQPAEQPVTPVGRMITIKGTIDSGLKSRISNALHAAVRDGVEKIIIDLQVGPSDFGNCYDLAREIAQLGGTVRQTIAFVSKPLTGHAVLIALACDEIVMAPDARIGDVYRDRPEGGEAKFEITAYQEIARGKGHGTWLPLAMVDKNLRLIEITTPNGKQFLPADRIDEFKQRNRVLKEEVVKETGERLYLDAAAAERLGLIRRTAANRTAVALAYGLPEGVAAQDSLFDEGDRPVVLKLEGTLNGRVYEYVRRRLKQAQDKGHNLMIVEIDSTTGDETATNNIASVLRGFPAKKVAWVPRQATGAATLVLFGCDELVMAPGANVGGFQAANASPENLRVLAESAVDLARETRFPEAMVRGLVDPNIAVFQVQGKKNPGVRSYKTADELADPTVKDQWDNPRPVKEKGVLLRLDGVRAHTLDVAIALANSFDEVKGMYNVGNRLSVLQPTWVDALIDGLTSAGGTVFLIVLGLTCLYIEIHMPGFGVAGLMSVLCFALFFWSRWLSETANSLEIGMFILGLILLGIELFVLPGFGVTGLTGVLLMIASLILASQSFTVPQTEQESWQMIRNVVTFGSAVVVFLAMAFAMARYFPNMPILNRMVLAPPSEEDALLDDFADEETAEAMPYQELLGKKGSAVSPLRPAGRMLLGDRHYDVITQGEFIQPGTPVEVIAVYQNRIVVRDASIG